LQSKSHSRFSQGKIIGVQSNKIRKINSVIFHPFTSPCIRKNLQNFRLLRLLARTHQGLPLTVTLDNARYQRCALLHTIAAALGSALLYLPAYAPNLNLLERQIGILKHVSLGVYP